MRISGIRANQRNCLIFFMVGGILCVILDVIGIGAVTPAMLFHTSVTISLTEYIAVPVVFAIAGAVMGIGTKRQPAALFYGACIGQCQFLLPLILYYLILHSGSDFDAWWRALCGLPLTTAFAGIGYSIKTLLKNVKK